MTNELLVSNQLFTNSAGTGNYASGVDAPTMLAECEDCFDDVCLISLDHDLNPQTRCNPRSGHGSRSGQAARRPFPDLSRHHPFHECRPGVVHAQRIEVRRLDGGSGRTNRRRLGAQTMVVESPCAAGQSPHREFFQRLPTVPNECSAPCSRWKGLAIGDAIGEMLAYRHADAARIIKRGLPAGPWFHTDDTEMALSIVDTLKLYGHIHQDELARRFAWRFEREPDRGYGSMTRKQLDEINRGGDWRQGAASAFGGQGSMGKRRSDACRATRSLLRR